MKKLLMALMILLLLVGCAQPTNAVSYEQGQPTEEQEEKEILYIYGDLNEDKYLNNLEFKTSTCWQHMRSDVNDKLVGKYDEWSVAIYTDTNFVMVFGYIEDEDAKKTTSSLINSDWDVLIEKEFKDNGYSLIEVVQIDDRYGYIVDVSKNKETKRILYINENGGKYEVSFGNQTDSLSTLELQFAYDYIKTLHFKNSATSTNS